VTTETLRPAAVVESLSLAAGRHDLRLVPAALVGWAVVLCGLHLGSLAGVGLGAAGLLAAGTAAVRGRSAVLLAIGGVVAALALVVGMQTWRVEHHPVRAAAEGGSTAMVTAHLRDDPRAITSPGYGGQQPEPRRVVVQAELETAEIAGYQWRTGGRVILLAPAGGWTGLLPGQRVRATGELATPDRSDLTVAVLRVRGGPEVLSAPTAVQRAAERLRSGLRVAARVLDPEPAGLLPALVVGDKSVMVPAVEVDFRVAGLTHLIAVSGESVQDRTSSRIPDPRYPVAAGGGQPRPIRSHHQRPHPATVAGEVCKAVPVLRSQIRTSQSVTTSPPAEASQDPSGATTNSPTEPRWPVRVRRITPILRSQIRTFPSMPAEASQDPSGATANVTTTPMWPVRVCKAVPVLGSQIRTSPEVSKSPKPGMSPLAEASQDPSGATANAHTRLRWPVRVCKAVPVLGSQVRTSPEAPM
jgi:Domain of unknown function (DUF4131)